MYVYNFVQYLLYYCCFPGRSAPRPASRPAPMRNPPQPGIVIVCYTWKQYLNFQFVINNAT